MPNDRLRAELARLREAIAGIEDGDPARIERLRQLADEVERELDDANTVGDPDALSAQLEAALAGFEASYPNLTAVVNSVLVALGNMGV